MLSIKEQMVIGYNGDRNFWLAACYLTKSKFANLYAKWPPTPWKMLDTINAERNSW